MIPHLVQMDKRYSDKGLVIIAPELQGSSKERIEPIVKKFKINYTITRGGSGPVPIKGIPHCFVFDCNGIMVFNGHPSSKEFDRAVKNALKDVEDGADEDKASSGPLFTSREWTNLEGKTIRAEVLSLEGDKVKFRMPNSSVVLYDLSKLSEDDQKLIKEKSSQR